MRLVGGGGRRLRFGLDYERLSLDFEFSVLEMFVFLFGVVFVGVEAIFLRFNSVRVIDLFRLK